MASGFFAAKFFGAISAKIITRIVKINVPTHTYSSPNSFITKYVKRAEITVLGHRIILKPEARIRGVNVEEVIGELLMTVQVPAVTVE